MSKLSYQIRNYAVRVYLDGQYVGDIFPVLAGDEKGRVYSCMGWKYHPRGDETGGDIFPTIKDVQKSLENDD